MDVIDIYEKIIDRDVETLKILSNNLFEMRERHAEEPKSRFDTIYKQTIYSVPDIYKLKNPTLNKYRNNKKNFLLFSEKVLNFAENIFINKFSETKNNIYLIRNIALLDTLNNRQQIIVNEKLNSLYETYLKNYNNINTFSDLRKKNDEIYFKDRPNGEPRYYNDNEEKNKNIIVMNYTDRIKDLERCKNNNDSQYNSYDVLLKSLKNRKKSDAVSICNEQIWGFRQITNHDTTQTITNEELEKIIQGNINYNLLNSIGKPNALIEDENKKIRRKITSQYFLPDEELENTHNEEKQRVFGYSSDLYKYYNKPSKYVCLPHPMALPGRKPCGNMAEWSLQLNMAYTLCSIYSKHKFIRFILPEDTLFPEHQRKAGSDVSDFEIFKDLPVGCLLFEYKDDRKTVTRKRKYLLIYVFYNFDNKSSSNDYTEYANSGISLYTDLKKYVNYGEIFYSSLVTYNELTMIKCDSDKSGLNMKTYYHKKYPRTLFFTKRIYIPNSIYNLVYATFKNPTNVNKEKLKILIKPEYDQAIRFLTSNDNSEVKIAIKRFTEYGILTDSDIVNLVPLDIKCATQFKNYKNKIKERIIYMNLDDPNIYNEYNNNKKIHFLHRDNKIIVSNKKYNLKGGNNMYKLEFKDISNIDNSYGDIELLNKHSIHLYEIELFNRYSKYLCDTQKDCTYNSKHGIKKFYDPLMFISDYMPRDYNNISVQTYDRIHKISILDNRVLEMLNKKINRVTLYHNVTPGFYNKYEILARTGAIKNNMKIGVYSTSQLDFVEAINYYKIKFAMENVTIDAYTDLNYINESKHKISINSLVQFIKFNIYYENTKKKLDYDVIFSDYFVRELYTENGEKIKKIFKNYENYEKESFQIREIYHKPLLNSILFALDNLKKNGTFIIFIGNLDVKFRCDVILLLSKLFEKYELLLCKKAALFKLIHTFVVFTNYQPNESHIELIKELFTEYYKVFTVKNNTFMYDPKLDPYGFINKPLSDKSYDIFREYNNIIYKKKSEYMYKLYDMNLEKEYKLLKNAYVKSIEYAKKYDFEILELLESDKNNNYLNKFYFEVLTKNLPLNIEFDKKFRMKNKTFDIDSFELMKYDKIRYDLLLILIDTRNIDEYFKYKQYVRYYKPHGSFNLDLRIIIQNKFNTGKISQAWLKMYEILSVHPNILQTTSDTYNTFHICEAPGNFIAAMNHYIKVNSNKKFNWYANSLNPKTTDAEIGDQNGYIKKYPNKWLFGSDNTGDITILENIKYYSDFIKKNNINLITSDCGLPISSDDSHIMLRVHLAEFVLIMKSLSVGGNFVAKFFFPIYRPLDIYLIYCLYKSFNELYIYKPIINIYSSEFYLIGKNYSGTGYDIDTLYKLIDKNNFDPFYKPNIPIDDHFIKQLSIFNKKLIDDYAEHFKKQLFYVDYRESFDSIFVNQMKMYISRKNDEWIEQVGIKTISTNQRL